MSVARFINAENGDRRLGQEPARDEEVHQEIGKRGHSRDSDQTKRLYYQKVGDDIECEANRRD